MRIPDTSEAYVAREKITQYLLNHSHPEGESKAGFFSRFGFRAEDWGSLSETLRIHAASSDVVEVTETDWGTEYVVEGVLEAPDGRSPQARAVWIVDRGSNFPRLITAYPPR